MENFQIHLEIEDQSAVFKMKGDLTHTSEEKLLAAYEKATNAKASRIFLDFGQVDYINSAGMSIIITMLTQAQEENQELKASGLSEHFQKIFDMVGLMKYIEHYDTLADAMKSGG